MSEAAVADTRRLNSKPQDLTDAYGPPSNFLEIDIFNPQTVGVGRARYTSYELRMRTNLPIFKLKESCVRRRYSDFEWLKNELERDSKVSRETGVSPPGHSFLTTTARQTGLFFVTVAERSFEAKGKQRGVLWIWQAGVIPLPWLWPPSLMGIAVEEGLEGPRLCPLLF
ncbi:sorting nexin-12 isoform X1 [Pogona vitticeps]